MSVLSTNTLVLATRNRGKVAELRSLLSDLPIEIVDLDSFPDAPDVEEDRDTLEGNALKKAETLGRFTGLPALADDTGLEVDALDGRPGVFAARYAGPGCTPADNRKKMLGELEGVEERGARFRTVMALYDEGNVRLFEGICEGEILSIERGSGGFGYDPIFRPDGETLSFAELTEDAKNRISHRGKAVEKVVHFLHGKEQE